MEEKTYIITFANNLRKRITVPADWKVTFGPAAKGANTYIDNRSRQYKMPLALRFYESDTKQRAIFTDVVDFRDSSIKIEEEKVRVHEKEGFMECEGVKKSTVFRASTKEWVDPDEPVADMALLPLDSEMFGTDED